MLDLSAFPLCPKPRCFQRGEFPFCGHSPLRWGPPDTRWRQGGFPISDQTLWPDLLLSHRKPGSFLMEIKAAIQAKGETIISRCKLFQQVPEEVTQCSPRFLPKRDSTKHPLKPSFDLSCENKAEAATHPSG